MLLDLTDVLFQDGKVLERSLSLEMDRLSIRTGSFPLRVKTPLQLTVVNAGEKVLDMEGHVELTAVIPCARCLSPVEVDFALDIQRRVDMKMTPREREEALEETNFIEDGALVPETLVRNELLVQWPVRVLCKGRLQRNLQPMRSESERRPVWMPGTGSGPANGCYP